MDFLIMEAGGSHLAFAVAQVESIHDGGVGTRMPLASAVGLGSDSCERVLVCRGTDHRRVEFGVGRMRQYHADRATILRLPRMLQLFGPPRWLTGLLVLDTTIALIVNLMRLADDAGPDVPPELK